MHFIIYHTQGIINKFKVARLIKSMGKELASISTVFIALHL